MNKSDYSARIRKIVLIPFDCVEHKIKKCYVAFTQQTIMVPINGPNMIRKSLTDLLKYSGDSTFVQKAKCHFWCTGN